MFRETPEGVYCSTVLDLPWLRHGFGSRRSEAWPGAYTYVKQIHSNIVLIADDRSGCLGQGDALVTNTRGRRIGVRTADCVPVLIVDPVQHAVAAVHAGWRGTVANIAARTVGVMAEQYGSPPRDLLAAIGPCIGECCFQVGREVAERFVALFPDRAEMSYVDLVEANRRQLATLGVRPEYIDASDLCTVCEPDNFHSYRRDKELAGRMVAAVGILEG